MAKKYSKHSASTRKQMQQVEGYLIEKYGSIKPQWEVTLSLMADDLDMLEQCNDAIKEYGIYDAAMGRKNPLIATAKDLNATLLKIAQQLGITPWAESKMRDTAEDDPTEFIDNLTQ